MASLTCIDVSFISALYRPIYRLYINSSSQTAAKCIFNTWNQFQTFYLLHLSWRKEGTDQTGHEAAFKSIVPILLCPWKRRYHVCCQDTQRIVFGAQMQNSSHREVIVIRIYLEEMEKLLSGWGHSQSEDKSWISPEFRNPDTKPVHLFQCIFSL